MGVVELKKKLVLEEEMLKKLEFTIYQTMGKISVLKELISQETKESEETK